MPEPTDPESTRSFALQLQAAGIGDADALGKILDRFRRYLELLAATEIGQDLQAKMGASDIVQQSFMEAQLGFDEFQGTTPEELCKWLQQITLNNVRQAAQRYRQTDKRDVAKERVFPLMSDDSVTPHDLPLDTPSPSQKAATKEEIDVVEQAVARLPGEYQTVLRLRHQENRSFNEIGETMQRSPDASRKLWGRAILALQKELEL